mgnify:CR=1 FL=1|tara:strand:+ start:304 stop:537 length:234 start_codon:yes stop_codon:yes gene_type:complete
MALEKQEVKKPLTDADLVARIYSWSESNYGNSYTAQTVVEGCWSDDELVATFKSFEDFKLFADIKDDYAEDIMSTAF